MRGRLLDQVLEVVEDIAEVAGIDGELAGDGDILDGAHQQQGVDAAGVVVHGGVGLAAAAVTGGQSLKLVEPDNQVGVIGGLVAGLHDSAGVVGDEEGTKPRKVLMTKAQFDAYVNGTESDVV